MLSLLLATSMYFSCSYQWVNYGWKETGCGAPVMTQQDCYNNLTREVQNALNANPPMYLYEECVQQNAAPIFPTCTPPNCPKTAVMINN